MSEQPKKIKTNFLAKPMQHFVLDPIKTPAEADKRIKEILPILGIAFGCVIVFILLGNLLEPVQWLFNILGFLSMAVVFVFGFFFYKAYSNKKRLLKLQCDGCKAIIRQSGLLHYSINEEASELILFEHKPENKNGGYDVDVTAKEIRTINMHCKCQNCGKEKHISELFTVAKVSVAKEKNVPAIAVPGTIADMKKRIHDAHADNHFQNAKDYDVRVELCLKDEEAIYNFFNDDGTASNTPIGKVTKSANQN